MRRLDRVERIAAGIGIALEGVVAGIGLSVLGMRAEAFGILDALRIAPQGVAGGIAA